MNQTITAPNAPAITASNICCPAPTAPCSSRRPSSSPPWKERPPMYRIVKKRVLNPTEILGYNNPTTSATHATAPCAVSAAWRWNWASRTPRAAARAIDEALSKQSKMYESHSVVDASLPSKCLGKS